MLGHIDANGYRYYHPDELGSTLLMTDEAGNITDQFAYQPYGELINRTGSTVTPYKWLGGLAVRDEGGSLYFMLNRYYSADQKRFLTEDPAGIDGGVNLYAYANLNPVFFVDPFGLGAEGSSYSLSSAWNDFKFGVGLPASPSAAYVQSAQNSAWLQNQAAQMSPEEESVRTSMMVKMTALALFTGGRVPGIIGVNSPQLTGKRRWR